MNWTMAKEKLDDLKEGQHDIEECLKGLRVLSRELAPYEQIPAKVELKESSLLRKVELVQNNFSLKTFELEPQMDPVLLEFAKDLEGRVLSSSIQVELEDFLKDYQKEANSAKSELKKLTPKVRRLRELKETLETYQEMLNILAGTM